MSCREECSPPRTLRGSQHDRVEDEHEAEPSAELIEYERGRITYKQESRGCLAQLFFYLKRHIIDRKQYRVPLPKPFEFS